MISKQEIDLKQVHKELKENPKLLLQYYNHIYKEQLYYKTELKAHYYTIVLLVPAYKGKENFKDFEMKKAIDEVNQQIAILQLEKMK